MRTKHGHESADECAPDHEAGDKPTSAISKRNRLVRSIAGLVICMSFASIAFVLDVQGMRLTMISERHSLMHALFIIFTCLGAYMESGYMLAGSGKSLL